MVLDPVDGSGSNEALIPPPFGSGTPVVFNTYNVPVDTDNDGVPDAYEITIGTDPNVFENQAVLDNDGNGYVNIEDWAHSLVPIVALTPPSKPMPPTALISVISP